MTTMEVAIRSVQHYLYCPHRWGLLEIDRSWAENAFVTKANLLHKRVHKPDDHYYSSGKNVFTGVHVYCDEEGYELYGVLDCLEAVKDDDGVKIAGIDGRYRLRIVEYKPTKPKGRDFNEDDLMQVFAQKKCVDYIFGADCSAVIYYADVRKRVELPFREKYEYYDERLRSTLRDMRDNIEKGRIPPITTDQKCSGCSMKDICMPALKKSTNLRKELSKLTGTES